MANEVFEMVHPREAPKGSKKSFACISWKSKSVIWLFFVSLFSVPNLSWSAQPTVRMSQPTRGTLVETNDHTGSKRSPAGQGSGRSTASLRALLAGR